MIDDGFKNLQNKNCTLELKIVSLNIYVLISFFIAIFRGDEEGGRVGGLITIMQKSVYRSFSYNKFYRVIIETECYCFY